MFEVPSQQILTTDSVTLTVDAVVYYRNNIVWLSHEQGTNDILLRVFDPVRAATITIDYNEAVKGLASSTLGGILGTYQLGSLLEERLEIYWKFN